MVGLYGGGGGVFGTENCEEGRCGDVPFGGALGATFCCGADDVVVVAHVHFVARCPIQ